MVRLASHTLAVVLLAGAAAFVVGHAQDRSTISEPGASVPEFARRALVSPNARKADLFISPAGRISKSSVVVSREGIPSWVVAMADGSMGKGEDLAYEVEVYPDGSEVYEVYRRVEGQERQLSVRADNRKIFYLGVELKEDELPASVKDALARFKDFRPEKRVRKEGPAFYEIHVKGERNGVPCRMRFARDGTLLAAQKRVPAEIEVPLEE
jgi:hypothetical protein